MKYLLLVFIPILLSCRKSTTTVQPDTTIEYQLTTADSTLQVGVQYTDQQGTYLSGLFKSGWKYTFKLSHPLQSPFTALLSSNNYINPPLSVTIKILVDGKLSNQTTGIIDATHSLFIVTVIH